MAIKVGVDAGNNGTKIWSEGQDPFMIPAVYSEYLGVTVDRVDSEDIHPGELHTNFDATFSSPSLLFSNTRYIVGQKVLNDHLEAIEMERISNKATDDVPVITTLTGLTIDAIRRNPDQDKIKETYDLGVALPVGTINPEVAKEYEKRYEGTHTIEFHHPTGRNVRVEIEIEFCKCLPEGASAAWGVVYDENGKVTTRKIEDDNGVSKVSYEDKTLLHFDIGAGTTEIVVTQGVAFKPTLSEGRWYGTKQTILDIIKRWNKVYERKTIDSIVEFNEIFFDSEHPRHIDLKEFSVQFFRQLAKKFSADMINKIDEMKDDPYVFVYGGGAALIKQDLEVILKHKKRAKNVIFLNDPIFVNARGLLVYVSSPRFKQQKESKLGVSQDA